MTTAYEAPILAQRLAIEQACRSTGLAGIERVREVLAEVTEPVLESAGKFARDHYCPVKRFVGARKSLI